MSNETELLQTLLTFMMDLVKIVFSVAAK